MPPAYMQRLLLSWLVLTFALVASSARAATVTLAWDPNTESDLAGYRVLYGTSSGTYTTTVDVGNVTTWAFTGALEGQTYYFVVQAYNTAGLRSANSLEVSETVPVTLPPGPTPGPTTTVSLNRGALYFGAVQNGFVRTSSQTVMVNFANGAGSWMATTTASWLEVLAPSGAGPGTFSVRVKPGTYFAGTVLNGSVVVTAPGVSNSPRTLPVTFRSYAAGANPVGFVDSPANNATGVVGTLSMTGWALDDVEVKKVTLYRDRLPIEGPGEVLVGTATFVDGARPDVEAGNATPMNYRAGWGYMLLTNMLPGQGNGTFRLHAYAEDAEGHRVLLGSRTITCTNASSTRPFGTIDTPGQGAQVAGSTYANWGWALTPQPKYIPYDGSTITVFVDGVPVGHPQYNLYRGDIFGLFPGLMNSNGAVGVFTLDTTTLSNGVHQIAWSVVDSGGQGAGLGSRYFTVLNGVAASTLTVSPEVSFQTLTTGQADVRESAAAGEYVSEASSTLAPLPESATPSYIRTGFDPGAPLELVETDSNGTRHVTGTEMGRLEVTVGSPVPPAGSYEGYLLSGDTLAPLPQGTFLDRRTGEFFWHIGAGYVGKYELVFVRTDGEKKERIPLRVTVEPRSH